MIRTSRTSVLTSSAVVLTAFSFLTAVAQPGHAAPTPADDTPTLLTPKGEHEDGSDEAGFDKLRDAYYESRLLAGDGGGLDLSQAAALRESASVKTNGIAASTPTKTVGGAWTQQGPSPIVQNGRTTNAFQAVAGRIGALAIRKDGTIIMGAAGGGVWTYSESTKTWTSRTKDTDTQTVGALAIAPSNDNVVYMGSGEGSLAGDSYSGDGMYRSSDGGVSWTHVSTTFTGQAVTAIAIDPTNANHLYASTVRGRGGIRRTSAPTGAPYGVYESTNAGATWTLKKGTTSEIHGATDLVMDPQNAKVLYASFWGDAIYKSTDGGATWATAMTGLPAGNFLEGGTRFSLGISHPAGTAHATLYTGFDYFGTNDAYHQSRVYKSSDDATTWAATATGTGSNSVLGFCGTQCFYDNVMRPDPTDPNTVYVLGLYGYSFSPPSGGIWRSKDGGATWKNLGYDLHPDYHAFAFQPNDTQHVVLGNDGGVWQSHDGGGRNNVGDPLSESHWEDLNGTVDPVSAKLTHSTGLAIAQYTSIATVPQVPGQYWGGLQDNGTVRKSTANSRWFDQASGDGGQVIVDQSTVNPLNPNAAAYVFGSYYGISPYRYNPSEVSTFFGNEAIDGGINMNDRAEFYVPWVQNRGNVNQMFLGTYRLYRSDNVETPNAADVNFKTISPDLTTGCTGAAPNGARGCLISAIGVADGGDGVYVGSDDGVVSVSPDAVTSDSPSWHRVGQGVLPNRPVTQFAVDKSNWRIAYAAYAGFGAATPSNRGHVFATTDGGTTWTDITGNLPDIPVNSVVLNPSDSRTIAVGTDVGPFVSVNGGGTWQRLGTNVPKVSVWQLDYDASHGVLAAGTHGRGAYTLQNPTANPALVVSKADSGKPVGPGSTVNYTITVKNIGNAAATGVMVQDPLPAHTSFVSAGQGATFNGSIVIWKNQTVPAGGSLTLTYSAKIDPALAPSITSIVNDGITVKSDQHVGTSGSPHTTPIAPAHALLVSPSTQSGAAKVGQSASYIEHVTNQGYQPDTYSVSSTGSWPTTLYDATCTTPITTTPVVAAGDSTDVCVKVAVPADAANDAKSDSTLTVKSTGDPTVTGTATLTTIAVAVDTLLVDNDNNQPNVASIYQAALTGAGKSFSTWDLSTDPVLPETYLKAHKNVVWFTGNSYPDPVGPYETELASFLDGGGRLLMSGQDILDQAAGTTPFVKNYLHVSWDGSESQNDKATTSVTPAPGNPITVGLGSPVPLDHSVLGANYEDQITPISPATSVFTDTSGAADGLSVDGGAYKVVFLAFPLEAFGTSADKATLMGNTLTYFGS